MPHQCQITDEYGRPLCDSTVGANGVRHSAVSSLALKGVRKQSMNAQESSGGDEGMKGDAKWAEIKRRFVKTMKIAYQQCITMHNLTLEKSSKTDTLSCTGSKRIEETHRSKRHAAGRRLQTENPLSGSGVALKWLWRTKMVLFLERL